MGLDRRAGTVCQESRHDVFLLPVFLLPMTHQIGYELSHKLRPDQIHYRSGADRISRRAGAARNSNSQEFVHFSRNPLRSKNTS